MLEGRDWRQGGEPIQSGLNKSLDNLLLSQIPLVESESELLQPFPELLNYPLILAAGSTLRKSNFLEPRSPPREALLISSSLPTSTRLPSINVFSIYLTTKFRNLFVKKDLSKQQKLFVKKIVQIQKGSNLNFSSTFHPSAIDKCVLDFLHRKIPTTI